MTVINPFLNYLLLLFICSVFCSTSPAHAAVSFRALNTIDVSFETNQGDAVQGGLLIGKTDINNKVWLDDKNIRVADDGTFIIGFGRDATRAELRLESSDGTQQLESITIKSRNYKIERVDGLPPGKVNPKGEKVLQRIRAEASKIKAARAIDDDRMDFMTGFIWPAQGRISGVYGSQRILNGEPKWPHYGVDIAAPTGTPIVAPASGIVTMVHADMYYSGGTLIIDHGFGLSSTFLHLSEILVKEGETVLQGSEVAKIGATGRATGPHLDWRINWFKVRLDAQQLVGKMPRSERAKE